MGQFSVQINTEMIRLMQNPHLKGIRPMIQEIEDVNWMLKPELANSFEFLCGSNLKFDALVKPPHLKNLHRLLSLYPELKVVIDHGAKPDIASGDWKQWSEDIAKIADSSEAYCKLSGLLTEADEGATIDDVRPIFEHLLSCFGPERLMWGSDWPVLKLANNYDYWLSSCLDLIAELAPEQQQLVMRQNAIDFYGL